MNCHKCGALNLRSASKCIRCGALLINDKETTKNYCPNCGSLNLSSSIYCMKCGSSLKRPNHSAHETEYDLNNVPISKDETLVSNTGNQSDILSLLDGKIFPFGVRSDNLQQVFNYVRGSSFVRQNPSYAERADQTSFVLINDNYTVNAFATDYAHPEVDALPPFIAIYEGTCLCTKVGSICFSLLLLQKITVEDFKKYLRTLGQEIQLSGEYDTQSLKKHVDNFDLYTLLEDEVLKEAKSVYFSVISNITSHELGHICLDHTLGRDINWEMSRNQEREADSFASSILSSNPYGRYSCFGGMLWWLILIWVQGRKSDDAALTTHPHSEERLEYLINANKSEFDAIGINNDTIQGFLP